MKKMKLFLLFIGIVSILSGCGFKLRGVMNLPPQMHRLYLDSYAPYGELTQQLKQNLYLSKVQLVDSADQANLTLKVINESITTHQTTVASSDQNRNYSVNYSVSYAIQNQRGRILVGPKTIDKNGTITLLANEVIGNSNKLNQAEQSMRQDAIYSMMLQLSSKSLAKKITRASYGEYKKS